MRTLTILLFLFLVPSLFGIDSKSSAKIKEYCERMEEACLSQNIDEMVQLFAIRFEVETLTDEGETIERGVMTQDSYRQFLSDFTKRVRNYKYKHKITDVESNNGTFVVTLNVIQSYESENTIESVEYEAIEKVTLRSFNGELRAIKISIQYISD